MNATIYVSKMLYQFSQSQIMKLAELAAQKNQSNGITGYLWFDGDYFLQYVEGDNNDVDRLMVSINQDKRHRVMSSLSTNELSERKFPNWRMKLFEADGFIKTPPEKILTEQILLLRLPSVKDEKTIKSVWRSTDVLLAHTKKAI